MNSICRVFFICAGYFVSIAVPETVAANLVSRSSVTNFQHVVDFGIWSGKATLERQVVAGMTNFVMPLTGSQQLCIETVKARVSGLLGACYWVDMSLASNGSFASWFAATNADFPNLSADILLNASGLPTDWLSVTPFSGLATNTYGWTGFTGIFSRIIATKQTLVQIDSTYEWASFLNLLGPYTGSLPTNYGDSCSGYNCEGTSLIQTTKVRNADLLVWHHAVKLGWGQDSNTNVAIGGFADRMKSKYRIIASIPTNYTPLGDAYHRAEAYVNGGETVWPSNYTAYCGIVTTNTYPFLHPFQFDVYTSTNIDGITYLASSYDYDFDAYSGCGLCSYGGTNWGQVSDDGGEGAWEICEGYMSGGAMYWQFGSPYDPHNPYADDPNGFFVEATMLLRWNTAGGFQYIDNAP